MVKNVRIGAYLRVSTSDQARDGYGLETQLRHIKNTVTAHEADGWQLVDTYRDEGVSGSLMRRKELDRMLLDVRKGKLDLIIVWKVDRLSRGLKNLLEIVDEIGKHNVNFKSVTEPYDSTSIGMLFFQIMGAMAEFERNNIKERTYEGKITALKAGFWVGTRPPYGYTSQGKKKNKQLIIDEEEAKWVRKMFDWFANKNWSVEKIAEVLKAKEVLTRLDKKKRTNKITKKPLKKAPPCHWNPDTIRSMLKATNYIGYYYFGTHTKIDGVRIPKPEDEWEKGICPPIISRPLFQKAQRRLAVSNSRHNANKSLYLLNGKLRCGECGSAYTCYTSAKGTKGYRCIKKNRTKVITTKCTAREISEKKLLPPVWEIVERCLTKPDKVLKEIENELKKDSMYQAFQEEREDVTAKLEQMRQTRRDVRELHRMGHITMEELVETLELIEKDSKELEAELTAVDSQLRIEEDKEDKVLSLKELRKQFNSNLKRLTYEKKRELLQQIVKEVQLEGEDMKITLRVPKLVQEELNKTNYLDGDPSRNRTYIYPLGGGRSIH